MNEARLRWIDEKGSGLDEHGEGYEQARSSEPYANVILEAERRLRESEGEDGELFHRLRKIDDGMMWIRNDPQLRGKADDAYRLLTEIVDSDRPAGHRSLSHHFDLDKHLYVIAGLAFNVRRTVDGEYLLPEAIDVMAEEYISLPVHTDLQSKSEATGISVEALGGALNRAKRRGTSAVRGSWS